MKWLSRLVLVGGAVLVGLLLVRAQPRRVTLAYGLPAGGAVTSLEVDIRRRGEEIRHAEFRFPGGAPATVRHDVRLPDGDYVAVVRLAGGGAPPRTVERSFAVSESGPIVLPIGER